MSILVGSPVQHHHPARPGEDPRHDVGQPDQRPRGDRVELPHVPEGEPAQKRPQGRGGAHVGEHLVHAAVAQQVHVVDAVRARQHPGHQRHHLGPGRPPRPRHRQPLLGQIPKTDPVSQRDRRNKPRASDQIRLVERC